MQRLAGLPEAQERDDRGRREQRGDDVGELDRDVVRAQELPEREREPADTATGQAWRMPRAAVDHADQDQRHDQGEEGGLAADHRAEVALVEAR